MYLNYTLLSYYIIVLYCLEVIFFKYLSYKCFKTEILEL